MWEISTVIQPETVLRWSRSGSAGFERKEAKSPAGLHLGPTSFGVSQSVGA